ncbi:MAG: hypothetical protein IPL72_16700 [Sulfuritalea sp.]|nr:hypothetical protein [Sulfuritalea sp.]
MKRNVTPLVLFVQGSEPTRLQRTRLRRFDIHVAGVIATVCLAFATAACGRGLPDPVVKKDGVATIPINGLLFVIPEKTWLTGYSRNSTDGLVAGFSLHAAAPKVEPWSPERQQQMYKMLGWGNRIEVRIASNKGQPLLKQTPEWIASNRRGCRFQASPLHKAKNVLFCETTEKKLFGLIEDGVFRYQIKCDSDKEKASYKFLTDPECHLWFIYREKLSVDTVFAERYFVHGFDMARAIERVLTEFDMTEQDHAGNRKGETK